MADTPNTTVSDLADLGALTGAEPAAPPAVAAAALASSGADDNFEAAPPPPPRGGPLAPLRDKEVDA